MYTYTAGATGLAAAHAALGAGGRAPGVDPSRSLTDPATYAEPHQYATGMVRVFVNGTQVVKDGQHTGATPGRVVRVVRVMRGPGWTGWPRL